MPEGALVVPLAFLR